MAKKYYNQRDIDFLLYEVFDVEKLKQYPYFSDHDKDSFAMVLEAAAQIAEKELKPYAKEMDEYDPQLIDGKIIAHPQVRRMMQVFGEGGWIPATFSYEEGGQQLPNMIMNNVSFIWGAANYSSMVYPFLTTGSSNLIRTFGSKDLQQQFLPNMFAGKWQGTMAMTEPDAGSSLSDITTSAEPTDAGYYKIKGQKIFISGGDHDGVDNIVNLTLARIKDAPKGIRGISLFVVPQKRIEKDGSLADNDVITAGVYHKMGYAGTPIAHLTMGENNDCRGYLVGEANRGLNYMFQMMNEARVSVGISAVSIASAAYYASLEYALERPQGRKIGNKDLNKPQIAIIEHADVKRMLLFQKSIVEGSLSLCVQCSQYADLALVTTGEEKERNHLLLDLLTPIVKTYPSEMGCLTTSAGLQILGGAGYCKDFPLQQYFREARIHPIHEGTTGIHGLDLLGRKVMMKNGKAYQLFMAEVQQTIETAQNITALNQRVTALASNLKTLHKTSMHLLALAKQHKTEEFLSDATLYLEMFGIITVAWQWLKMGVVAHEKLENEAINQDDKYFYQGKIHALRYFYEYELPKTYSLVQRLISDDKVTLDIVKEYF
ncbi:MAG: acyl-CoA dehydrogenase [Chitinophagales bacterium]